MAEFPIEVLRRVSEQCETPCYVYLLDPIRKNISRLHEAFEGRFGVSYAVKSNPAVDLLRRIAGDVDSLDCSSIAEVERGLRAGYSPSQLTFSGPAKRVSELRRAVEVGIGAMICESVWEMEQLNEIAGETGLLQDILIRINPRKVPPRFGVNMAGKPSQFGIDEEDMTAALEAVRGMRHVNLDGFHIYSGTNSLDEAAIGENFGIFIELFRRFSEVASLTPKKLIFGSGFGIPYLDDQEALDLDQMARLINPQIDKMREDSRLSDVQCSLEMGRWIIGPNGFFLTRVVNQKDSRGSRINMCDGGFNNHLAACGMMGTVIRRNWPIALVSPPHGEVVESSMLTGPLCTTIDQIATNIELPQLQRGDVIGVAASGAYGVTASPNRFISHPEPCEYLIIGTGGTMQILDVTESKLNHPVESGMVHES